MWCMHSIFSVKSVFLGSTAATCKNVLRSSVDEFPQVRATGIVQHTSIISCTLSKGPKSSIHDLIIERF